MVKKALLVGINYYSVPSARLNGCINDVVNMKAALIANYGYAEKDIVVLRDDTNDARYRPTAQNIVNYLYSLIQVSGSCEEVWFHYSGHGSQIRDTNGDEASGYDSVIVPVDFQRVGVITDDYIYNIVKNVRSRAVLLFDSCNSGTVCDLAWSYEYKSGNTYTRTQNNRYALSNKNIYMISGCKDTQTSADAYDTTTKSYEGAFTDAFLQALKKNSFSAPILNIYRDTCITLANNRFSQKPILSSSSQVATLSLKKTTVVSRSLQLSSVGGDSVAATVDSASTAGALKSVFDMRRGGGAAAPVDAQVPTSTGPALDNKATNTRVLISGSVAQSPITAAATYNGIADKIAALKRKKMIMS